MTSSPAPWALAAAELPIAFSQVREDPRLDVEIAKRLPLGARGMMIASGGEAAVCLARLRFSSLVLVDVNPAQLALTRSRFWLAANYHPRVSLALLGHLPMDTEDRWNAWSHLFRTLDLPPDSLGKPSLIAQLGPDHSGRYEAAFQQLRHILEPHKDRISQFLQTTDRDLASQMIATDTETGTALDSAFAQALRLENLVTLFGEEATRNPRKPFHIHFMDQLRDIVSRQAPATNPWIWQLLAGKFPLATPIDWLDNPAPIIASPTYLRAPMLDALAAESAGTMDFIHLSNILDWLSPDAAAETLAAAHRALRPGGYVIIRQLNSSLDIPSLCSSFIWHIEEGKRLQRMDRSFFYPNIHLASRK